MKKLMSFLAMTTSMSLLLLSSLCASSTINDSFFDVPEEVTFPQNFRIYAMCDFVSVRVRARDRARARTEIPSFVK